MLHPNPFFSKAGWSGLFVHGNRHGFKLIRIPFNFVNFQLDIDNFNAFFFWTVHIVLEHDQAIFDPVYNSWSVWRWPVGLRDLWLHTLLPASWPAIIRSCKVSQGSFFIVITEAYPAPLICVMFHSHCPLLCTSEVPSQPSLQNSNKGLWNNFDPVGSRIWHAAFYENCRQEHLILTGSSALQSSYSDVRLCSHCLCPLFEASFPVPSCRFGFGSVSIFFYL